MSEELESKPTTMFRVVGVVALLWNLVGLFMYYTSVTATPESLAAQFTPEQIAMIEATPAWATSASAIAVTAGVLASVLLLLRMGLCVPLFIISLVAIVVQDVYIFGMTDSIAEFGMQPLVLQGIVFVIALFLVGYSRAQQARGVIR